MPRRQQAQSQSYPSAETKANRLLGSPLSEVGKKLLAVLSEAKENSPNPIADARLLRLANYVAHVADRVPQSFGQRFHFDSALIVGLSRDWGRKVTVSGMIVPRHGKEWGHERVMMPSEDAKSAHFVDLVLLPRDDRLEDVDLLTYPLMIHELNHYVFLRYDTLFIPIFEAELENVVRKLRLAAISDRGSARTRAQKQIDELVKFWTPRPDQKNWAHELAIDIASLWMCGPAYMACFHDMVENLNPYEITATHPPCAVRAEALIIASRELGLQNYATKLKLLSEGWRTSHWKRGYDNRYAALTRDDLIEACIKSAFYFCGSLDIPACTGRRVDELSKSPDAIGIDEIGINLLVQAWLQFEKYGEVGYSSWERKVVAELTNRIM